MAHSRSVASLGAVLSGLRRLAVTECSAAAPGCAQQHHAAPSLASLRSFVPAMACWSGPSSLTAQLGLAAGHRHFAAAAAAAARAGPAQQQQAEAGAGEAAEQQQQVGAVEEEETLEQIRSRIFGTHIGNGLRSGRKVLRRPLMGQKIVDWYPGDPLKADPLMPNFKADNAKLKLDRLRRRGKAPPKKGAGKRSSKKR